MKILWCGDAVASTGFAKCTHNVCDYLHSQGHEIHVLGINYYGDPLHKYPYTIYPTYDPLDSGHDIFGESRLPRMIERLNPDVVIILQDPWNIKGYINQLDAYQAGRKKFNLSPLIIPPIIPWLAVDSCNQKGYELNYSYIKHIATWTEFAKSELISGGYKGTCTVIPLGVDTNIFYPRDRSESRIKTCGGYVKDSDFVIGVVGRNQPRKRLDLTIYTFSEWIKRYNILDAWLYLHVAPTGDRGYDLLSLIKYFGISGKVIINEPNIGYGDSESLMPYIYSSFDLYFSTSQAEGWGLPCLEAMACGVECLVPNQGSLGYNGGWIGNDLDLEKVYRPAATRIKCSNIAITAPLDNTPYTVGGVIDVDDAVDKLNLAYYLRNVQAPLDNFNGIKLAKSLNWRSTGEKFESMLKEILKPDRHIHDWEIIIERTGAKISKSEAETSSYGELYELCSICKEQRSYKGKRE